LQVIHLYKFLQIIRHEKQTNGINPYQDTHRQLSLFFSLSTPCHQWLPVPQIQAFVHYKWCT